MPEDSNYDRARQALIAKTKRRRTFFDGTKAEHRSARKLRRQVGGAFGKADDATWRAMSVGTSRGPVND